MHARALVAAVTAVDPRSSHQWRMRRQVLTTQWVPASWPLWAVVGLFVCTVTLGLVARTAPAAASAAAWVEELPRWLEQSGFEHSTDNQVGPGDPVLVHETWVRRDQATDPYSWVQVRREDGHIYEATLHTLAGDFYRNLLDSMGAMAGADLLGLDISSQVVATEGDPEREWSIATAEAAVSYVSAKEAGLPPFIELTISSRGRSFDDVNLHMGDSATIDALPLSEDHWRVYLGEVRRGMVLPGLDSSGQTPAGWGQQWVRAVFVITYDGRSAVPPLVSAGDFSLFHLAASELVRPMGATMAEYRPVLDEPEALGVYWLIDDGRQDTWAFWSFGGVPSTLGGPGTLMAGWSNVFRQPLGGPL